MPRHRIERTPRQRTPWPARYVVGRVRLLAAGPRPRRPGHARPGTGPSWAQLGAGAARYLRGRRPALTGAARGLLVSPWFAAGAGVVIAAGAFAYAPHAQLKVIPNPRWGCSVAGCREPQAAAPAVPAGGGAGRLPQSPSPAASPAQRRSGAGVTVSYQVLFDYSSRFGLEITLHSRRPIGDWRLGFAIPGSTGLSVDGALWQPSGPDRGTASGPVPPGSQPSPGPNYPSSDVLVGSHTFSYLVEHAKDSPDTVYFFVLGAGSRPVPDNCTYDGRSCHFLHASFS